MPLNDNSLDISTVSGTEQQRRLYYYEQLVMAGVTIPEAHNLANEDIERIYWRSVNQGLVTTGGTAPQTVDLSNYATKSDVSDAVTNKSDVGHTHTQTSVGLGNVNNTADIDKPMSTPQKQWLDIGVNQAKHALAPFQNALNNQTAKCVTIVNSGSSTANGGNVTAEPYRWFNRLAALYGPRGVAALSNSKPANGFQLQNMAVGGTTSTTYMSTEQRNTIIALNPDLVFHMVGSNDFHQAVPIATYRNNLRNNVTAIRDGTTATQILIHQNERYDTINPANPWDAFGQVMKDLATEFPDDVICLDMAKEFRKMGLLADNNYSLYDPDKIHMQDAGNRAILKIIANLLDAPDIDRMPQELYRAGSYTGGNLTNGTVHSFIEVPKKPYIRNLTLSATMFAGTDSGAAGDYIIRLPVADVATKVVGSNSGSVIVRCASTVRQTYSGVLQTVIQPHQSVWLECVYAPNGGSLYMSAAAGYANLYAQLSPA